jgi:WD40 repeat protein
MAFSPDGTLLATASVVEDGTVGLWEVATGRPIRILTGHTDFVMAVAFSPDGTILATASDDKTARLWALIGPAEQAEKTLDRMFEIEEQLYRAAARRDATEKENYRNYVIDNYDRKLELLDTIAETSLDSIKRAAAAKEAENLRRQGRPIYRG